MNHLGHNLARAVRQDPKKSCALGVLLCVMSAMWGRVLLTGEPGPGSAAASIARRASDNPLPAPDAVRPTPSGQAMSKWLEAPITPLGRNLFAAKLDYFPLEAGRPAETEARKPDESFWDRIAKSMAREADQRRQKQILVENLRVQATRLRLQTIVMGAQPKALIDDKLVGEGDVVANDFRVRRIEARRIIIEREGILLEVQMK